MKNVKKLLVVVLLMALMMSVCSSVFATEADQNVTFIPDEGAENTTPNNTTTNDIFGNTNTNTNVDTNTNTNTNVNTNANSSQYTNSDLPKAGSTDTITVMIVIAVFGVSALYAYKKIKDYNLK